MSTNSPATVGRAAGREAREVHSKAWFGLASRSGFVSRALIYALLAYFALDIAIHGSSPAQATGTGALTEVARQPGAPVFLALLSLGLLAYGSWRIVSAIGGTSDLGTDSAAKRIGWCAIAVVYFILFGQAISLITGSGTSGGGPTSLPTPFVARVLRWPAGPELVGLAASAIICGGIALAVWACVHEFDRSFETERMSPGAQLGARVSQIVGDITRGALIALIGIYALMAAVTDDPLHVKSLGQVLETLTHETYGSWLIGIAALGLLAFSISSMFEAAYRRV
jgi:hypothetical protein